MFLTIYFQLLNIIYYFRTTNTGEFRITSVAAHQNYSAVAITDTLGRINVLRGNLYDKRTVAKEVLHWHFLPPLAVCFSLQGNKLVYLIIYINVIIIRNSN